MRSQRTKSQLLEEIAALEREAEDAREEAKKCSHRANLAEAQRVRAESKRDQLLAAIRNVLGSIHVYGILNQNPVDESEYEYSATGVMTERKVDDQAFLLLRHIAQLLEGASQ